jgi:hypothetical protein
VISVDREHGTEMDHIASVTATHLVTQVGYIVAYKCRFKKILTCLLFVCEDHKTNLAHLLLKINQMMVCNFCVFS